MLDATKFASCTVEVTKLDRELNATVWDQDGKVWWSSFNTGSLPQYTKLTETPANEPLAAVTYGGNGKLYAASLDTSSLTSNLYTVDPETFETTLVGGTSDIGYVDLTAAPGCRYLPGSLRAVYRVGGPRHRRLDWLLRLEQRPARQ